MLRRKNPRSRVSPKVGISKPEARLSGEGKKPKGNPKGVGISAKTMLKGPEMMRSFGMAFILLALM